MPELPSWLRKPYAEFAAALEAGRLPGSVIFACPEGLGARDLVAACARLYLCHSPRFPEPCAVCRACELNAAGTHPDFLRVRATASAEGASALTHSPFDADDEELGSGARYVRIDDLRELCHWLSESAALGHGKAAIIENAQLMQQGAANAVLKTFEEPPSGSLIIMWAQSFDTLLPTILSRALKISVAAPSKQEGLQWLSSRDPRLTPQGAELALTLCRGEPLSALAMAHDGNTLAAVGAALGAFAAALSGRGGDDEACEAFAPLPSALTARALSEFVLEVLKYKAGGGQQDLPLLKIIPAKAACALPADHLFKAWRELTAIAAAPPLLPSRAPVALLRAWLYALKGASGTAR